MDWVYIPNNAVELIGYINEMQLSSIFRLVCKNWKLEHDHLLTKVNNYVLDENYVNKMTLLSKFKNLNKINIIFSPGITFSRLIFENMNLTCLKLRIFEMNIHHIEFINTLKSLKYLSINGLYNSNSFQLEKKNIFDISSLINLTELTLNVINGKDEILTENFSLTQLHSLNIHFEINNTKILSKLINLKKLKCIYVSGSDKTIHPICLHNLEEIHLIKSETLLAKDIMNMSSKLKTVVLIETFLDSCGIKALSYNTNLEMLSLTQNDRCYNHVYGFNFELLTNLTFLDFSRNRIANIGMKGISSLIKLKTLIMDRCIIDDTYIEEHISKLTNLTFLRLYGNHIQDYDVIKITILSNLTHLDLSLNKISNLYIENDYSTEKFFVKIKHLYISK